MIELAACWRRRGSAASECPTLLQSVGAPFLFLPLSMRRQNTRVGIARWGTVDGVRRRCDEAQPVAPRLSERLDRVLFFSQCAIGLSYTPSFALKQSAAIIVVIAGAAYDNIPLLFISRASPAGFGITTVVLSLGMNLERQYR